MEWHGANYWTREEREVQKGMESQDTSWNISVSRKQSCPLSVEINISWFSPNTYSARTMKMNLGWTFQQDTKTYCKKRDYKNVYYIRNWTQSPFTGYCMMPLSLAIKSKNNVDLCSIVLLSPESRLA